MGARNGMYFFCLQVDGPITGRTYKGSGGGGVISGSLRYRQNIKHADHENIANDHCKIN